MPVAPGTVLSCENDDCGCRIQVQVPCPHGDAYSCACGHTLTESEDGGAIPATPGA